MVRAAYLACATSHIQLNIEGLRLLGIVGIIGDLFVLWLPIVSVLVFLVQLAILNGNQGQGDGLAKGLLVENMGSYPQ